MDFGASLVSTLAGPAQFPGDTLVLNEIGAVTDATFRVELANLMGAPVNLATYQLRGSNGGSYTLNGSLAPGGLIVFDDMQMGFRPVDGKRLFLVNTVIGMLGDGRVAKTSLRGRNSAGVWGHPSGPTFGEANTFTTDDEIVINETMYNAPNDSAEE